MVKFSAEVQFFVLFLCLCFLKLHLNVLDYSKKNAMRLISIDEIREKQLPNNEIVFPPHNKIVNINSSLKIREIMGYLLPSFRVSLRNFRQYPYPSRITYSAHVIQNNFRDKMKSWLHFTSLSPSGSFPIREFSWLFGLPVSMVTLGHFRLLSFSLIESTRLMDQIFCAKSTENVTSLYSETFDDEGSILLNLWPLASQATS